MTDVPLAYSAGALVLQKSAFEKIPAAQRESVTEIFTRKLAPLKDAVRRENQQAIRVLTSKGIKTVTPAPEDLKEFQALVMKGISTLGNGEFSKSTLNEISAFVKASRKED